MKTLNFILLKDKSLPEILFDPLIRAAVNEPDVKFNRAFVAPCVRAFGLKRTAEALLRIFETGSNSEKVRAANALDWATEPGEVETRRRCAFLEEFVRNEDLAVRRSLAGRVDLDPANYPADRKPLVDEAIRIAKSPA